MVNSVVDSMVEFDGPETPAGFIPDIKRAVILNTKTHLIKSLD